jgi:hypothetical protein
VLFSIALILVSTPTRAADLFLEVATNPSFQRDVHIVSAGSNRIGSSKAGDSQHTGISSDYLLVASNIWNNEHNQILGGIGYGRRAFDQQLALPDGLIMPERLENASAAFIYKHITSRDWSISQSVRYTRSRTDTPSIDIKDTFDLVGMAAVSYKPGVVWAFGYYYDQTTDTKNHLYPVIEYVNTRYDRWAFTLGYPALNFAFSPHPDLVLAGGSISYKVTEQNFVRLSIGGDRWAYRLEGPNVKGVAYTSSRASFDWTYLYPIDHRTSVVLNAALGWGFNRELEADSKLPLDDAAVIGFNASLSF